jgi:UDP-glucose 4-epimerase
MDHGMSGRPGFHDKKILVTGGAGFLGSALVRSLLDAKGAVTVLDDFSTGSEKKLPVHPDLSVIRGSVTDPDLVREAAQGAELIFHLAATPIGVSLDDPLRDCMTNVLGTLHVLSAARQSKSVRRVTVASTDSVYGNSRYLPINEDDSASPLSPFAASKLSGESYCRAFYESFGVPVTVLRYGNLFGPRQDGKETGGGVVARFIRAAMSGGPLTMYGDGGETRDFLFVEDAVEATVLSARASKAEGQIYNVGSGFETTIADLAQTVIELSGRKGSLEFRDRKDVDNIRRRVLNIEKIRKDVRWTPTHTLEQGLKKTIQWAKENSTQTGG